MDVNSVIVLVILSKLLNTGAAIGVNYGTVADNLPPPSTVVNLIKNLPFDVNHIKIFSSNHDILKAFINEKHRFVVGVPNQDIPGFASSVSTASDWVKANISPWAKIIETVAVGNEILLNHKEFLSQLVPAMKNVKAALDQNNLGNIQVRTPVTTEVFQKCFPSSEGEFNTNHNDGLDKIIPELLSFLTSNKYPFMVNVYPYFAWLGDRKNIQLDYALFQQKTNLFDAMVDCGVAALRKAGHPDMKIVIGESGWPSAGEDGVGSATIMLNHVNRPGLQGAYIFALFNENQKDDKPYEKHWGLLYPNGSAVYALHR